MIAVIFSFASPLLCTRRVKSLSYNSRSGRYGAMIAAMFSFASPLLCIRRVKPLSYTILAAIATVQWVQRYFPCVAAPLRPPRETF
jgi:hypothetical protein